MLFISPRRQFGVAAGQAGLMIEVIAPERCSRSTLPVGPVARNCNVNLDDLRWDRPDPDCEPQQTRGTPRNLQLDGTLSVLFG